MLRWCWRGSSAGPELRQNVLFADKQTNKRRWRQRQDGAGVMILVAKVAMIPQSRFSQIWLQANYEYIYIYIYSIFLANILQSSYIEIIWRFFFNSFSKFWLIKIPKSSTSFLYFLVFNIAFWLYIYILEEKNG